MMKLELDLSDALVMRLLPYLDAYNGTVTDKLDLPSWIHLHLKELGANTTLAAQFEQIQKEQELATQTLQSNARDAAIRDL
jgi:hypothetical protein